jgi:hypothetical protein
MMLKMRFGAQTVPKFYFNFASTSHPIRSWSMDSFSSGLPQFRLKVPTLFIHIPQGLVERLNNKADRQRQVYTDPKILAGN